MRLSEFVQQLFAVHPGHSLVGHHHGNIAVIPEGKQGFFGTDGAQHPELGLHVRQLPRQVTGGSRFVIDNQNRRAGALRGLSGIRSE